jgi:hypothetical protein
MRSDVVAIAPRPVVEVQELDFPAVVTSDSVRGLPYSRRKCEDALRYRGEVDCLGSMPMTSATEAASTVLARRATVVGVVVFRSSEDADDLAFGA